VQVANNHGGYLLFFVFTSFFGNCDKKFKLNGNIEAKPWHTVDYDSGLISFGVFLGIWFPNPYIWRQIYNLQKLPAFGEKYLGTAEVDLESEHSVVKTSLIFQIRKQVGNEMVNNGIKKCQIISYMLTLGLVTPIGIIIGIVLTSSDSSQTLVVGVMQGLDFAIAISLQNSSKSLTVYVKFLNGLTFFVQWDDFNF